MRAILIDPAERTVEELELKDGLVPLYEALSIPGLRLVDDINVIELNTSRDTAYVDGEGNLIPYVPVFQLNGGMVAGKAVIVRTDEEGDSVSTSLPVEHVRKAITWLSLVTTGELGPTTSSVRDGVNIITVGDAKYRDVLPALKQELDVVWQGIAPDALAAMEEPDAESLADTLADTFETHASTRDPAVLRLWKQVGGRELALQIIKGYV